MTSEQFKKVIDEQLFRPFTIHLADGRAIPVKHREFAMVSPSGRTVVVYQPNDAMNIIDLLLVTDLEISPNGSGTRRKK